MTRAQSDRCFEIFSLKHFLVLNWIKVYGFSTNFLGRITDFTIGKRLFFFSSHFSVLAKWFCLLFVNDHFAEISISESTHELDNWTHFNPFIQKSFFLDWTPINYSMVIFKLQASHLKNKKTVGLAFAANISIDLLKWFVNDKLKMISIL